MERALIWGEQRPYTRHAMAPNQELTIVFETQSSHLKEGPCFLFTIISDSGFYDLSATTVMCYSPNPSKYQIAQIHPELNQIALRTLAQSQKPLCVAFTSLQWPPRVREGLCCPHTLCVSWAQLTNQGQRLCALRSCNHCLCPSSPPGVGERTLRQLEELPSSLESVSVLPNLQQ